MNKKRILAVVLVFSLIVSMISFSASAVDTSSDHTFVITSMAGFSNYHATQFNDSFVTVDYQIPRAKDHNGSSVPDTELVFLPLETDQFWCVNIMAIIPESFLGKTVSFTLSRMEYTSEVTVNVMGVDVKFSSGQFSKGGGGVIQNTGETSLLTILGTGHCGGAWTLSITDLDTGEEIHFDYSQLPTFDSTSLPS